MCRAVFFAKLVADLFGRGLFETYLELSCVPFLAEPMTSSSVSSITNQLSVADVMARGVTALPPVIAVSELLHMLQTTPYSVRPLGSALMQCSADRKKANACGVIGLLLAKGCRSCSHVSSIKHVTGSSPGHRKVGQHQM